VPTRPAFVPAAACRFSTASPAAPDCNPPRDASLTRHQQGFTVIHPTPAFPSPVTPGGTGSSGFPLSFAPSRAGPGNARQGGDRPGHCLDYVPGISQPPSTYSLTTCDLTSQRTGRSASGNSRRKGCCDPRRVGDLKLFEPITMLRLSRYATAKSAVVHGLRAEGSAHPRARPDHRGVTAVQRRHVG
jgi:hypothetical protein